MKKKKILTYPTSHKGMIQLNLNEKAFTFSHLDFSRENSIIPFLITHIYQNGGKNKGYGKGFSFNLEQTLTKIAGTSKYRLSLADGSEEIFEEVYYYKDSQGTKIYKTDSGELLQRSDITLAQDGALLYKENKIFVDLKSDTGLTLISDYNDFKNSEQINLKNEELYQLEQEIEQCEANKKDLDYQLEEYQKYFSDDFKALEEAKEDYQAKNIQLAEVQKTSTETNLRTDLINAKKEYYQIISKENRIVGGLSSTNPEEYVAKNIYYKQSLKRFTYKDEYGYHAEGFAILDKYANDKFKDMSEYDKLASYYNQVFSDKVSELNQQVQDLSFAVEQNDWDYQKKLIVEQQNLAESEFNYLTLQKNYDKKQSESQKEYYTSLIARIEKQIQQIEILLEQKKYQKTELEKQLPELYLSTEEGLFYGYNNTGKLCAIFDAYEHQAVINYNSQNQIKEIIDSEQNKIEFIYNESNHLIRMVDEEDHYIDFEYNDEYLKCFKYSNDDIFSLNYANDKLVEIKDIDSIGYQMEYVDNNLSKLKYISFINNSSKETVSFSYLENQIKVATDKNNLQTIYLFDDYKSLITECTLKDDQLDSISSYEYESNHCNFVIKTNQNDKKIILDKSSTMTGVKSYQVTPFNAYTSDYILYGFVEADSYQDIRKKRVTAYCEHIDNDDSTIMFELRCLLNYSQSNIKEYSVSFNPNIKGKQFVAIPITLDENSDGIIQIPNAITVYMDYSGNKGNCTIENITLAQGAYTYCEYDQNHHKIYECSNEIISIQTELLQKKGYIKQREEIEYFYNPKDLLEKKTSIHKVEHFNLDDMIVTKDEIKLDTIYAYNKQGKLLKVQDSNGKICEYIYNNKGICIQKKFYHSSMPNMMYMEEFDDKKKPEFETNELGYKNQYQYLNNSIVSITTPNGNVLYSYSSDNASSISTDVNGEENFNTSYYDKGRLIELKTNGMNYRYTYDEFGREKELYINDNLYCKFFIEKYTDQISYTTIYNDNTGIQKISDLYDKPLKINRVVNETVAPYISYEYNDRDQIVKEYHYLDNQEETIEYIYVEDVLVGIKTKGYTKIINHDLYSNETLYQIENTEYSNQTTIDKDGKVINYHYSIDHSNDLQETYSYDPLERLNEVENPLIKQQYHYLSKNGRTTNLISTLQKNIKDKYQRYIYQYDKEGNICSKKENHQFTRYKYDQLNRLVREDNEELNQTIIYSYDFNGNLLNKEIYSYSLTDNLENNQTMEYNYSDFNDYLTQFNEREIKYDSLGNPILYKDIPLVWKERELKKYGDIEYTYDVNHIRTRKHSKDSTIEYVLDGTTILKEKRKYYTSYLGSIIEENSYIDTYEEELEYIYSSQGIIGFDYNKGSNRKRYYYNKNILGDIIEIYNEEGNLVGKYSYDAYGNHKILVDIDGIASINPYRYRSYYYDSETGLFYCNSRYYSPELCRWISPDSIEYLDPSSINGLNLYCYCYNNPISYADPSGNLPFFVLTAIIGAVIGVGITAAVDYIPDQKFDLHWSWYVGAGVLGAVIGAGIGMVVSYYATGSIASSTGNVFSGLFGKTTFYRTMSADDYANLQASGKLPAGTETFISPSSSYASTYNGITVKFTVRNRTVNWLTKIGVKDGSTLVGSMYPSMPMVSKGWMATNAFFKAEQGIINIGLGYGKALDIFNKGIIIVGLI